MNQINEEQVVVTTPQRATAESKKTAIQIAGRLGVTYCPRKRHAINRLLQIHRVRAAIVVGGDGIYLNCDNRRFGFHPNMVNTRLGTLRAGRQDRLVNAAGLKPGFRFLDGTCGLASDAIIASYVVGKEGKVSALESSGLLATIVRFGLQHCEVKPPTLKDAMRRITVIHEDHTRFLKAQPADSWDIVYFDPMFKETLSDAESIDLIRLTARHGEPDEGTIDEAQRVAKLAVVIKDRSPGPYLQSMGIPVVSDSKRICYGRLDVR